MTLPVRLRTDRPDFMLNQVEFDKIVKIAKSGWGLNIDDAKKPLIKSRLSKRLRSLGLKSFNEYCDFIEAGDQNEREHFVSALTTNVTHFYREVHHFEHLEAKILPSLISQAKAGKRVRIWSAGCSTGKEPYSIAGSILSLDQSASSLDLKILASDVDSTVLSMAQDGIYDPSDCIFPTESHKSRIFSTNHWNVRPELKSMISFRNLNLISEWPMSGFFDIIMCRNVAIYFDKPTQVKLWKKFCQYLKPHGHLFIGHSERITDPERFDLTLCGTTTYQLVSDLSAKTENQE